jgi:quinol monooxygenase YgiN
VIRHIVFFTVQEEHLQEVRAGLSILTGIPHARLLEIGTNVKTDQLGTEIDLVVYGEFDDEAALAAYKAHPTYAATTAKVRPMRELRLSADVVAR